MNTDFFSALGWCLVTLVWGQVAGMGLYGALFSTAPKVHQELPVLLRIFFQQTLGLAAFIGVLAVLAIGHVMTREALWLLFGMSGLGAAAAYGRWMKNTPPRLYPASLRSASDAIFLIGIFILLMLRAFQAPGHWDDVSYHLPLARLFVEHHGLAVSEYLRFPYFPANMQLLFGAGLLLSGNLLAQMLATLPVFVTLVGLVGFSQWLLGSSAWGYIAGALYLNLLPVRETLGFAYVDYGVALFCTAALLGVAVWQRHGMQGNRWLIFAGLAAGVAGGIKLLGLVFAAVLGLAIWVISRKWRAPWVFGLVCAAAAGGWYVRSYLLSGDPVHPVGGPLFGFHLWSLEDLVSQQGEQARHGVPKLWYNFFAAFSHAHLQVIWVALVAIVLAPRLPRPVVLLWTVLMMFCLFWFNVSQVNRYLMPVLPLACFLAVAVAQELCRATGWPALLTHQIPHQRALLATMGVWLGVVCLTAPLAREWYKQPSIQAQLDAQPAYLLSRKADEVAGQFGFQMMNVGYENARSFYSGQLLGDWFGKDRFTDYAIYQDGGWHMRPARDVLARMQKNSVNLLLIHSGSFAFDAADYGEHFDLLLNAGPGYLYAKKPSSN